MKNIVWAERLVGGALFTTAAGSYGFSAGLAAFGLLLFLYGLKDEGE